MAPQVGLEPTTLRLTAECSAIELLRNILLSLENGIIIPLSSPIVNPEKTLFEKKLLKLIGSGAKVLLSVLLIAKVWYTIL